MLTVGEFSRLTRLSAKQLRSYDALGLLAPARVDPLTGYRRYHPAQARTAITIAMLRALDVPLAVVTELLVADEHAADRLLEDQRARLTAELAARERTLRTLGHLTGGRELMPYPVSVTTHPPRRLIALRGSGAAETLHADASAAIGRLLAAPPAASSAARPVIGLFPLDLDDPVAFSVGVEVVDSAGSPVGPEDAGDRIGSPAGPDDDAGASGPPAPGSRLVHVDLPGGPAARVVHVGPHDELALAYFPLLAWARERGHAVEGPVIERYLDDPATTEPELLRTEISIPLPAPAPTDRAAPSGTASVGPHADGPPTSHPTPDPGDSR